MHFYVCSVQPTIVRVCVRLSSKALITAEVLRAKSQVSYVSAWDTHRFSNMRRILATQDGGIDPTAFDVGAKGLNH